MDIQSEKLLVHILANVRIAALGTIRDEAPRVSMVAFVPAHDFSAYYMHVSRLAQHTLDMQKNKQVSLLIAEPDDGRTDPQTLARLSIRGSAEFMENGEPGYAPVKAMYIERFPTSEPLFKFCRFWPVAYQAQRCTFCGRAGKGIQPDARNPAKDRAKIIPALYSCVKP